MQNKSLPVHRILPFTILIFSILLQSCSSEDSRKDIADLVILNGTYYTADSTTNDGSVDAIAINGNLITQIGSKQDIQGLIGEQTRIVDAKGKFIMPGFIEGHGHFLGLGGSLIELNFLNVYNWDTICKMVGERAKTLPPGTWIVGRGWHQEKLDSLPPDAIDGYPSHKKLSQLTPDHPVMLTHASGHGMIAKQNAMNLANINKETPDPNGGRIVRDEYGNPTGIFEERAKGLISELYRSYIDQQTDDEKSAYTKKCVLAAERECLKKGVTTFQDAGTNVKNLQWLKDYASNEGLKVRLWAMVRERHDQLKDKIYNQGFPWIGLSDNFLTVRAIKSEIDGALGAYGAWLIRPYNDKPGFEGQNTTPLTEVKGIAEMAEKLEMQFCVHAIGDKGNRITLDLFESIFDGDLPSKARWRVEHAQHLHPDDIPRFSELGVIAAMQAVHCTSDAPFVVKRLGEKRAREGAYAWRSLLDAGTVVTNGTDAPVEDVDPLRSFYASVTRKRPGENKPFMPHQKITREEALYSYTMSNAYAGFEEHIKGSLSPGKLADIVILDTDLLTCNDDDILDTKVDFTIVGGKISYKRE